MSEDAVEPHNVVAVRPRLRPTVLEVDESAIAHNVAAIAHAAGVPVCAVVKADGYGHGATRAARAAIAGGARWLAVALVEEGIALREDGIDMPVLVLSEPPIAAVDALLDARLTPTVYSAAFIAAIDAAARARDAGRVAVHMKLDTGMARVGVPESEWAERLAELAGARDLEVAGIQTHLARAEELEAPTTAEQVERFARGRALAREAGIDPPLVHVANTAGALAHPGARATMVRAGIGIYGVSPGPSVDAADHGLRPAARLVSAVSYVKRITQGTPVSYGHRWAAPRDGWLATVPIGYADGLPRAVRGRAHVLHRGRRRELVGSITMDQVLVWCDEHEPSVGDEVVLFGRAHEGEEQLRVEEVAAWADTIAYEVLTGIGPRVPRVSGVSGGGPP